MPAVFSEATGSVHDAHILIVGLNYWPEETGIAPYTTGLAEHLVESGARVTVIAGMPYYPRWTVPDAYRGRAHVGEVINGVDVLRFRQYVPARQSAFRRLLSEITFFLAALRSLRLPRPDVAIGVIPSLAGGAIAGLAARRYGVPYGLIIQDLVGQAAGQSGIAGGARVARLTNSLEAHIVRSANGVAVVSDAFRPHLRKMGVAPDRVEHLPNWSHIPPPKLSRTAVRDRFGWAPGTQVVLHAGNMGLKQGLEQLVAAARLAQADYPVTQFVLMGDGNQRPALERLAADLPNVTFLDPQPAEWFPEILQAADVLLVTQRASVTDMSLPSKLTSYFMAGRPVLAAASESSACASLASRSGAAIVVPAECPASLIEALRQLARDPELGGRLARAGKTFAEQHMDQGECLSRTSQFVEGLLQQQGLPTGPGRGPQGSAA